MLQATKGKFFLGACFGVFGNYALVTESNLSSLLVDTLDANENVKKD